ncbi:protein takeout-like [Sitodiplosis mosellana]|uniref:protein takeout-like n=1 Tax=Sitodiplosis mosellana TaxID=263140 RepID=UPI002443FC4B|nr:protein takeout-like [Sitodiplosis mosellana]
MFSNLIGICIFALCIVESMCRLPSTIKICPRNTPNPSQCILNAITDLRPRLANGDLGDGVKTVSLEPLALDNISVKRGPEFSATFNNLLVNGPSNFVVSNLKSDIPNLKFNFTVHLPKLTFAGKYSLKMRLLLLNIQGRGPISGVLENTRANVRIIGKLVPGKNGLKYVKFGNLQIKVSVGGAKFRLENLFNGDRTLGEIGNTVINENAQLFLEEMIPGFEKSLSKTFLEIANDILTEVTYDEMFPEA